MKKTFYCLLVLLALSSCKDKDIDLCEGIICENDGICMDGTCDCPEGYEGETCEIQKTPTAILITKVEVLRYPETNSWSQTTWDEDSEPDLFIFVRHPLDPDDSAESQILTDYSGGTPILFDLSYTMDDLDSEYSISLKDDDEGSVQTLDSGIFSPYNPDGGLPETIEITQPDWYVDFRIHLEYVF